MSSLTNARTGAVLKGSHDSARNRLQKPSGSTHWKNGSLSNQHQPLPSLKAAIGDVDELMPAAAAADVASERCLYVVRHGERIDFTFGIDWIKRAINSSGNIDIFTIFSIIKLDTVGKFAKMRLFYY